MKTTFAWIFVAVASYWLGYQAAMFNVEMGGKPSSPFDPYVVRSDP